MKRQVKHARLHSTDTFITGIGSLGSALPGSFSEMEMYITEDGLYLKVRNIEAFIPSANIKIVEFFPESKSKT